MQTVHWMGICMGCWSWSVAVGQEPAEAPCGPAMTWPDTLASQRAREFFEAVEAETDEPMRKWQQTYRSPESLAETPLEQRVIRGRSIPQQTGKLHWGKVVAEGDHIVDVYAKSEKFNIWLKFHFVFEEKEPHYLVSMQGTPSSAPDVGLAPLDGAGSLADVLEKIRKHSGLPALAAAVVEDGRITDAAAVGLRRIDQTDSVALKDRFHIGSIGKSMTATMIAKLVEDGTLRWDLTLGQALPDVPMRSEYQSVTLEALLQHRGGIQPYTDDASMAADSTVRSAGSPTQQRAAFAKRVLNEAPVAPPGTTMVYSNAGYALAGHMAERVAKKSWEELMKLLVFDKLGMNESGIGWPATSERPKQPFGHHGEPPNLRVQRFGEYDLGAYLAPAGDVHCAIEDLARFAAMHLKALDGHPGLLKVETVRRLHTPGGKEKKGYACGWTVDDAPNGTERHWHDGSAGTFFASMVVFPEKKLAVVVAVNSGPAAKTFNDQIVEWLVKRAD